MLLKSGPFPMYQFMWYTPGMGKGASRPWIGAICFPSDSNIGQGEKDAPMAGVEKNNTLTAAPSVDSEPADAGPSGTVTSRAVGSAPHGSPDQPAPLRCGTQKTQN